MKKVFFTIMFSALLGFTYADMTVSFKDDWILDDFMLRLRYVYFNFILIQ